MKVKYKPGNLGDLIKHFWLIEITTFLKRITTEQYVFVTDTFCGFNEYEIENVYSDRILKDFAATELCKIQKPYLEKGNYAGSVQISRAVLGDAAQIHIFDTNPAALDSFKDEQVTVLPFTSGYDVLDQERGYDCIFLDPYDDFWEIALDIVHKIAARVHDSNILLFTPFKDVQENENLLSTIDSTEIAFINGVVENKRSDLDSGYKYGMIFFPAETMPDNNFEIIAQRLITVTEKIRRVIDR